MTPHTTPKGPLDGLKIVEFAGVGPAPMCAMLLADLGATVLRIERVTPVELGMKRPPKLNLLNRNREVIALDLKRPDAVALALDVVAHADMLIEGYRPGVMERLGLGPDICLARNQRLIYGRMTGWGQQGPLASAAGHDLNYIAVTGALDAIGRAKQPPSVPLNLVGDFGGGSLYLALGLLSALHESRTSGAGQVVDAAIVDGALSLMTMHFGTLAAGLWHAPREEGGAFYYDSYECADGKWITVAAVEQRFYDQLVAAMGFAAEDLPARHDRAGWPRARAMFVERFKSRTREGWTELLEGTDACFAPVLSMQEVGNHPHIKARGSLIEVDGVVQPAPAPRFSRSIPAQPHAPRVASPENSTRALEGWFGAERYAALNAAGALGAARLVGQNT